MLSMFPVNMDPCLGIQFPEMAFEHCKREKCPEGPPLGSLDTAVWRALVLAVGKATTCQTCHKTRSERGTPWHEQVKQGRFPESQFQNCAFARKFH